ncbi:hypothetical protein BHE74_00020954 [Ensete ventricosum]|nr:hypothetical protein GW17_00037614 [Ensete ventricosum]RWW71314.1 hypothetical protein BHE74_00020954 [Ensete ventricosum]
MFLSPKTLVLRSPIPVRRRPPSKTVGKAAPVLGSTEVPVGPSAREREAQIGEARLHGFRRDPDVSAADSREKPTAKPIPAPMAVAARRNEVVPADPRGGFGGRGSETGKRREPIATARGI